MTLSKLTYLYDTLVGLRYDIHNLDAMIQEQLNEIDAERARFKPLAYEALEQLLESDEYEERGIHVYVQELPYRAATVAILDWFKGELYAVCGQDYSFRGRDYGKTWVAYLEKPVFDNE